MARAVLRSDPQLTVQLNLMLAECYGRLGDEERRLDALRRAAEGDQGPEPARIELARALAQSGKLDQAVTTLLPLAVRKPEWRLDLVRLLIQRTARQPRGHRNWQEVEGHLREAEKVTPAGRRVARPPPSRHARRPGPSGRTPGRSCLRSRPRIPGTSGIGSPSPG